MSYAEFNKTFNKRDYRGVVLECSIITLKGKVIFRGSVDEVDAYWDEHVELIWDENDTSLIKKSTPVIDGEEVITTNIGDWNSEDRYAKYIHSKLQFQEK